MQQEHSCSYEISDQVIKEQFAAVDKVEISASRFNHIPYLSINFGLGLWLPLDKALPLIGITPQMLRPIFSPQRKVVKRRFPFNLNWFGLNKKRHRIVYTELPTTIESYEQLGHFPLSEEPFQKFARILGKSVEVLWRDGYTGEHYPVFTIHPSGEIIKAV